jgi:hypothetical protein
MTQFATGTLRNSETRRPGPGRGPSNAPEIAAPRPRSAWHRRAADQPGSSLPRRCRLSSTSDAIWVVVLAP